MRFQKNCSFGIDYDRTFPRGDEWMMSVCGADSTPKNDAGMFEFNLHLSLLKTSQDRNAANAAIFWGECCLGLAMCVAF